MTILEIRLDWSELDLFGHINNVAFFKYFQAARVQFVEHIGLAALYEKELTGFIVAETNCRFILPLNYPGNISLHTSVEKIGDSSFILTHDLKSHDQTAATGRDVLVVYNYSENKKQPIPPDIAAQLRRHLS